MKDIEEICDAMIALYKELSDGIPQPPFGYRVTTSTSGYEPRSVQNGTGPTQYTTDGTNII